jgi:hypothetical protein
MSQAQPNWVICARSRYGSTDLKYHLAFKAMANDADVRHATRLQALEAPAYGGQLDSDIYLIDAVLHPNTPSEGH